MVPTLAGRIQTRLFLLFFVGVPWTALIALIGPRNPGSIGGVFGVEYWVLAEVAVVGAIFWEPLYHFLMQFRWEKDWPIMFSLLVGIPEGALAYLLLRTIGPQVVPPVVTTASFVTQFSTVWFLVWLVAIGPMRVLIPRWRFRGGQVL